MTYLATLIYLLVMLSLLSKSFCAHTRLSLLRKQRLAELLTTKASPQPAIIKPPTRLALPAAISKSAQPMEATTKLSKATPQPLKVKPVAINSFQTKSNGLSLNPQGSQPDLRYSNAQSASKILNTASTSTINSRFKNLQTNDETNNQVADNVDSNIPKRGDKFVATVIRFGPIGMSVKITDLVGYSGLILNQEIEYLKTSSKFNPSVGDTVTVFVQNVREDGKLDLCLRPVGYNRFETARDLLVAAMEKSPSKAIPLGDKSTPESIMTRFPGMSKNMYKTGLSALLREGAIKLTENEMRLIPESNRVPQTQQPYNGKTPRGFKPSDEGTLFIGNFPYETEELELAECIEDVVGYGQLAKIKLGTDRNTGKPTGFAYANFFTPEMSTRALKLLQGAKIEGRELRVAANVKNSGANTQIMNPKRKVFSASNKRLGGIDEDFDDDEGNLQEELSDDEYESFDEDFGSDDEDFIDSRSRQEDYETNDSSRGRGFGASSKDKAFEGRTTVGVSKDKVGNAKPYNINARNDRESTDSARSSSRTDRYNERGATTDEQKIRRQNKQSMPIPPVTTRDGRDSILNQYKSRVGPIASTGPSRGPPLSRVRDENTYSVFVGGLPYTVTEKQVKDSIESAMSQGKGAISEVRLVRNPETSEPRGFGFIDFTSEAAARKSVDELNGKTLLGRPIKLGLEGPKHRPKNY